LCLLILFSAIKIGLGKDMQNENFKNSKFEKILANRYCDSISKNLFKGLEKERLLKFNYFFSNLRLESVRSNNEFIKEIKSKIKDDCDIDLKKNEVDELLDFYNLYFQSNMKN